MIFDKKKCRKSDQVGKPSAPPYAKVVLEEGAVVFHRQNVLQHMLVIDALNLIPKSAFLYLLTLCNIHQKDAG